MKDPGTIQRKLAELQRLAGFEAWPLRATNPRSREPPADVVVIVHGTFANPDFGRRAMGRDRYWWETGGFFAKLLDEALERHGSDARCRLPFATSERAFEGKHNWKTWRGWSGANSEVERRCAAYDLAEHIRELQKDSAVGRIHIVAHSHGGNVARRALRYLSPPNHGIGEVICLGTPFLHFDDRAAWRRWIARVHWPMLVVLTGLAVLFWYLVRRDDDPIMPLVVGTALGAAAYSIWTFARNTQLNSNDARILALRFERDEAISLLRRCAQIRARPHSYLRDMLGGVPPQRPLAPVFEPFEQADGVLGKTFAAVPVSWRLACNLFAVLSNAWNGPICRVVERGAGRVPPLIVLLILAFKPYRPPLRPFLTSRIPRFASLFLHFADQDIERTTAEMRAASGESRWHEAVSDAMPFSPKVARTLVAAASALLYVLFYPIDKLLGLSTWVPAVGTRIAIIAGVRAAAGSAPGMDMLCTGFRPARTGSTPPGVHDVVVDRDIAAGIEQRLSDRRVDFGLLRGAIDPTQPASLADAVSTVFEDVELLHAQYYRDPRIVDFIAQCIAGQAEPAWQRDSTLEP